MYSKKTTVCRSKMDYSCELYSSQFASPERQKNLYSIHREGIGIYTCTFKTSLVKSLHAEVCDPTMELRRNELRLRLLYRLWSNSTYKESLDTLDDREDQNYVRNEGTKNQQDNT